MPLDDEHRRKELGWAPYVWLGYLAFYIAALFLAVFGVAFAPPADRPAHWLLLCVIAFVCGLHTLAFGHSRYHLPLMPLVLVYTAAALTNSGAIWRQRRSLRFVAVATVCAALVAGWAWTFIAVDLARLTGAA